MLRFSEMLLSIVLVCIGVCTSLSPNPEDDSSEPLMRDDIPLECWNPGLYHSILASYLLIALDVTLLDVQIISQGVFENHVHFLFLLLWILEEILVDQLS